MPYRKKLIEVALPLEAINKEAAREKSIRHGHPSTLHLWWARRPLAACRAVLFSSLVDDPDEPEAPKEYLAEIDKLPGGASLAPDASLAEIRREKLFRFIEELVKWDNSNNERIIGTARRLILAATEGNPPPVLDPFCGGGSIPLEAQRLGLEAHGSDLNPVAVLITKALIEIPPKFAGQPPVNPGRRNTEYRSQNTEERQGAAPAVGRSSEFSLLNSDFSAWPGATGLAADVRYYGQWMRDEAEKRIGHLYPKVKLPKEHGGGEATVIAWLWARTVKCPNPACGAQMPLVRSFALSTRKGKEAWVEPIVDQAKKAVRFDIAKAPPAQPGTVQNRAATCVVCGTTTSLKAIREQVSAASPPAMGVLPLAVVIEGGQGRSYVPATDPCPDVQRPDWLDTFALPEKLTGGAVMAWGFTSFGELFTPRQLVALTAFSDLVAEAREQVRDDALGAGCPDDGTPLDDGGTGAQAYADAVASYLGLAVDKMVDRNTSLCTWEAGVTRLRGTFGRQALPMVWDFAETNPFAGAGGDYAGCVGSLCEVLERLPSAAVGRVLQLDAAASASCTGLVCTDPPYYDNIGYADLSDFFYVWLRRSLGKVYPRLFSTLLVPKGQELVATPYRFDGSRQKAQEFFEEGLGRAFGHMRSVQRAASPLPVFYAFKQAETETGEGDDSLVVAASTGWETMLQGLLRAGLSITGTWPMRSELETRNIGRGTNALASSIVLVCRPRPEDAPMATRREFTSALRKELPPALAQLTHAGIAPVDLAQASIGPGMAVFSRYSKVLEADGSPMTVRTALQIINQELDAYLAEQEGDLDGDTRFCIAWFEQYGMNEGAFGEADVLARAKNSSVDGIVEAGVLHARGGKVRLRRRADYPDEWDPGIDRRLTVWECAQHLICELERSGEEGAAGLVRRLGGGMSEDARALAYRLYAIADRKGWTDEARAYNGLVVSWPAIVEKAARGREAEQGRLL